ERDRARAAASVAASFSAERVPPPGGVASLNTSALNTSAGSIQGSQVSKNPAPKASVFGHGPGDQPAAKKKAIRRSAVLCPGDGAAGPPATTAPGASAPYRPAAVPALPLQELAARAAASSSSSSSAANEGSLATSKGPRPPVPAFRDPAQIVRQMELEPKDPEDNYELSDCGGDSDQEDAAGERERQRGSKHVPKWCGEYLQVLSTQADVDPDTIFGSRVPQCIQEDIFTDDMYESVGKKRPKRARGSSGDWRK
ncbi:unnamed protein product, partial [Polarella glacialis]